MQLFSGIFWVQPIGYSLFKKNNTMNFCLFVYLQSCNSKSKLLFLQRLQSRIKVQHFLFANEGFLCKMLVCFFISNIPLYIEKIMWKIYVRFWKWNLLCAPQFAQNSFLRKSGLRFFIIFNMIWFTNAQGSVKIKLVCSKVMFLINYFGCRLWNSFKNTFRWFYSNKYLFLIKGNKYLFFIKVGAAMLI